MNPIRALHSKAIERACNLDRAWFAAHPGCSYRLRDPLPMEFNGPLEEPPAGSTWRVLVAGFAGLPMRQRLLLAMTPFPPNESYSQEELEEIFESSVPARFHASTAS